jgi:hypothetical protein
MMQVGRMGWGQHFSQLVHFHELLLLGHLLVWSAWLPPTPAPLLCGRAKKQRDLWWVYASWQVRPVPYCDIC